MDHATLCFTCGQPVLEPPVLNSMPDGEPCTSCRARALEAAPAILPFPTEEAETAHREEAETAQPATPELPFEDYPEPA
ncbi:MAG: hypothetical protein AAF682_30835 [Planctomycetota bacterium]